MQDKTTSRDPRHHLLGIIEAFAPVIPECEGEGLGDFIQ